MTPNAKKIALAGIGSAVSLIFVILGYYVDMLTLSFNVLATGGMMMILSKKYYKEAILSWVAVSVLGFFICNVGVLPYVMVGGAYTIFTVIWHEKGCKYIIGLPIKIAYSALVFFILYTFTKYLAVDLESLSFLDGLSSGLIYFIFNLVFSFAFVLYDYVLVYCYKYLKERLFSKIK